MTEAERLRVKIMSLFGEYFAGTISVKMFKREVSKAGREWLAAAKSDPALSPEHRKIADALEANFAEGASEGEIMTNIYRVYIRGDA